MSAITIPTLAYNYRAKVLEEQYRSAYSDLKQIGAMINYEKGDVGEYANKVSLTEWEKELTGRLNGGGKLESSKGVNDIYAQLGQYYKNGGGSPGPYYFHLKNSQLENVGAASKNYICDNGQMYVDSKGRIWTFNSENRIICVDINGAGNPNRYNMDILHLCQCLLGCLRFGFMMTHHILKTIQVKLFLVTLILCTEMV